MPLRTVAIPSGYQELFSLEHEKLGHPTKVATFKTILDFYFHRKQQPAIPPQADITLQSSVPESASPPEETAPAVEVQKEVPRYHVIA